MKRKMKKQLEVLVTSGGTSSEIDDIRKITNSSTGYTGALIAEEFLRNGAKVRYLHAVNSVLPFARNLAVDYLKDLNEEIERIKPFYNEASKLSENLQTYSFDTFEQYFRRIQSLLLTADVIVLSAAVSDYGAGKVSGKISSDKENLSIDFFQLPKVISLIKKWKPDIFQVGFKLLSDVSAQELIETAYKHGLKNNSDLTVANAKNNGKLAFTMLITPGRQVIPVGRKELAQKLVQMVCKLKNNQ